MLRLVQQSPRLGWLSWVWTVCEVSLLLEMAAGGFYGLGEPKRADKHRPLRGERV